MSAELPPSEAIPPAKGTDLVWVDSTTKERATLIDGLPWGARFPWPELQVLAAATCMMKVKKGGVIFKEAHPGDFMALLFEGDVQVFRADPDGVARLMVTVRSGQTLGEMSLVDEWTRSGTAIAITEARMIVLGRAGYDHLCANHPRVALRLMTQFARLISQRLRRASSALVQP